MTTAGGAPNAMLDGIPHENLARILTDRWRVEVGERALDGLIRAGGLRPPVAVAVIDIDGSAPVRLRGVAAKLRLVHGARELVERLAPAGALVTDSGERDEIYIVLPGSGAGEVTAFAEELRSAVAGQEFEIFGPDDTVRVTASIGCAVLAAPRSGSELFEHARDGLVAAKRKRDCVVLADPGVRRTGPLQAPQRLVDSDRLAEVLRTGVWMLAEKHGPIWYWVAKRGAAGGLVPELAYDAGPGHAPPAPTAYFNLLVRSTALEAGLTGWVGRGWPVELAVRYGARMPRGFPLVAQYRPGEWVVASRSPGDAWESSEIPDRIERARTGEALVPVPVQLGPYADSVLSAAAQARGRSPETLLAEALRLGIDHLDIHQEVR